MEVGYAYTVPVEDTLALEGSLSESYRLDLDADTEVVDMCGFVKDSEDQDEDVFEKDIVLDSDDEGAQNEGVEAVRKGCCSGAGRLSCRGLIGLSRGDRTPAGCFWRESNRVTENRLLNCNSARSSMRDEESNACKTFLGKDSRYQDHLVVLDCTISRSPVKQQAPTKEKLNIVMQSHHKDSYNEKHSPLDKSEAKVTSDANSELDEPTESQSEALGFVDHYLSNNDYDSVRDVEATNGNRIRSPPSLSAKGQQSLARRIYLGRKDSRLTNFDWVDELIENREGTFSGKHKVSSGFKSDKCGHVSVCKESDYVDVQKDKVSCLQSKEKLPRNVSTAASVDINSSYSNGVHIWGLSKQDVGEVVEVSDTPDAYDVGLDTQIAAEAMEALINTPLSFGVEHQGNTLVDSFNSVNKKCKLQQFVDPKEAFVGWSTKGRRSKCVKKSTVKLYDEIQKGDAVQLPVSHNMVGRESFTSTMQQGKDGIECKHTSTLLKEACNVVNKRRKLTIECKSDALLKGTCNVVKSRRKLTAVRDDMHESGFTGELPKSIYDSSHTVTAGKTKGYGKVNMDVARGDPSKLNMWIYPKGRRTQVSHNSIRSTSPCSVVPIDENSTENSPALDLEADGRMNNLLVYTRKHSCLSGRTHLARSLKVTDYTSSPSVSNNEAKGRTKELLVYTRKRRFSSQRKDPGRSLSVTCNTSSPSILGGTHIAKPPSQLCKSNAAPFSSSADVSGNIKLSELPEEKFSTLQERNDGANIKKSCEDSFKSPLSRELLRLSYNGSLPEILPTDSRRSKTVGKICVLLSQNLEVSIAKRQEKIVTQLGFSVVSCCSEATHFVADKFVRTRNLMEAIALGKPVVTHLWLESCKQAGYAIDEKNYILRDEKKEKEIGFSMPITLTCSSRRSLLKGCRVFITKSVKPSEDVINCLVKAVNGQVVEDIQSPSSKDKMTSDDLLILSSEEDYTACVPFLTKGVSIYNSELLLNGILTQKLDYERYQIFKDFKVKRPRGCSHRKNGNTISKTIFQ